MGTNHCRKKIYIFGNPLKQRSQNRRVNISQAERGRQKSHPNPPAKDVISIKKNVPHLQTAPSLPPSFEKGGKVLARPLSLRALWRPTNVECGRASEKKVQAGSQMAAGPPSWVGLNVKKNLVFRHTRCANTTIREKLQ